MVEKPSTKNQKYRSDQPCGNARDGDDCTININVAKLQLNRWHTANHVYLIDQSITDASDDEQYGAGEHENEGQWWNTSWSSGSSIDEYCHRGNKNMNGSTATSALSVIIHLSNGARLLTHHIASW